MSGVSKLFNILLALVAPDVREITLRWRRGTLYPYPMDNLPILVSRIAQWFPRLTRVRLDLGRGFPDKWREDLLDLCDGLEVYTSGLLVVVAAEGSGQQCTQNGRAARTHRGSRQPGQAVGSGARGMGGRRAAGAHRRAAGAHTQVAGAHGGGARAAGGGRTGGGRWAAGGGRRVAGGGRRAAVGEAHTGGGGAQAGGAQAVGGVRRGAQAVGGGWWGRTGDGQPGRAVGSGVLHNQHPGALLSSRVNRDDIFVPYTAKVLTAGRQLTRTDGCQESEMLGSATGKLVPSLWIQLGHK
ncbi:hypothetical protein GGX14DRAFT_390344 [Mycena pura]|uniref:Uncharacterized protein n=1 Tax=Mycena pura TaxID=153505 RepID=A0AAD6VNW9_9AGAR|nr:hypothetical protein GGX14DRAFT_390344 [Mycena pura]